NLVDGPQNIFRAGLGTDEYTIEAALLQQTDLFIARTQQEIGGRLDAPFEFQTGFNETARDFDATLTVDKKVVVDDIDKIEAEPPHQIDNFCYNSFRRQCIPGAAVDAGIRTE